MLPRLLLLLKWLCCRQAVPDQTDQLERGRKKSRKCSKLEVPRSGSVTYYPGGRGRGYRGGRGHANRGNKQPPKAGPSRPYAQTNVSSTNALRVFTDASQDHVKTGKTGLGVYIEASPSMVPNEIQFYMDISHFCNSKMTNCDNNQAEAYGATVALHYLFPKYREQEIQLKTDNKPLVDGVKKAIKKERTTHLSDYANLVHIAKHFQGTVSIEWIPREQNKTADKLARKGSGVERSRSKPSKSKSTTSQASKENPAVIQYDAAADVEDEIAYPFNTPLIAHLLDKSQKQALEDCITFA